MAATAWTAVTPGQIAAFQASSFPDRVDFEIDSAHAVQIEFVSGHDQPFTAGLTALEPLVLRVAEDAATVDVMSNGRVRTMQHGTGVGGMEIWHEVVTEADGSKAIRFPFSIPGF